MNDSIWWSQLGRLWERSTGGADVAARPTGAPDGVEWPTVPRAAGVDAASAWLKEGMTREGLPRLLFLIGGPGAGKSHAASHVVKGLEALDVESGLAQRTYRYALGGRGLTLVNDATIGSDEFPTSPLSNEIDAAISAGDNLLACVNRGVVVEELAQLRQGGPPEESAGGLILSWLHAPSKLAASVSHAENWSVEGSVDYSYIRAGRLHDKVGQVAEILVVFVDVNSLLEAAPAVEISSEEVTDLKVDHYFVEPFENRRALTSVFNPAGALFAEVIEGFEDPSAASIYDPFHANLQSMRAESVRQGVLSVLRASEIVSGQRLTFREVWGALSRSIIGGANLECKADELQSHFVDLRPEPSDSARQHFEKVRRLAEYRFSQALFGASAQPGEVSRDPVLRLLHTVDPVQDSIPGWLSTKEDAGWASTVTDAFSGDSSSASPLTALVESSHAGGGFVSAVTEFDRMLDAAYVAVLADNASALKERERHELTAWYGSYLSRLFATANGIPAFRREVSGWTVAWGMAPNVPYALKDQLDTLLKPVRYPGQGGGVALFPLFDSRTSPIQGDATRSRVAIQSKHVQVVLSAKADSLFVSVGEEGRESVAMLLDFAMMREAMACADGFTGATELSDATSPRLERFRAARLVPGKHMDTNNYRVVEARHDIPLTVVGAGQ